MKVWSRPKEMPSTTTHIKTSCGTLNLIFSFRRKRLKEVYAIIGKSGTCANILLSSWCKGISFLLQSPEPRFKIIKKLKKQFIESNCGMHFFIGEKKYLSCVHYIAEKIIEELEWPPERNGLGRNPKTCPHWPVRNVWGRGKGQGGFGGWVKIVTIQKCEIE